MSDTVPTIAIKSEGGWPVLINLSEYDEKKHEIYVEEKEESSFDRKTLTDFLDSKEIKYAKNISNEKLQKLYNDAQEEVKSLLSIIEKDDKIIIVDAEGNQVGAESFATKEEAEEMLKLFTGK